MEIEVLEQDKNRLTFRVTGAGHTFCNNLKNALYADDTVETAAYTINHPLVGTPVFIVEKKAAGDFHKILSGAAESIKKENKGFLAAFNKLK